MNTLAEHIGDTLEAHRRTTLDAMSLEQLRGMWDQIMADAGDVLIEGSLIVDCDDIHAALNRRGDGQYCAV